MSASLYKLGSIRLNACINGGWLESIGSGTILNFSLIHLYKIEL